MPTTQPFTDPPVCPDCGSPRRWVSPPEGGLDARCETCGYVGAWDNLPPPTNTRGWNELGDIPLSDPEIIAAVVEAEEPVHEWFELTYAQYLTIPRSILDAMPVEWQHRFVDCLNELDGTFDWRPSEGRYWVQLKDAQGRYREDPLMEYRHPDRAYIESLRTRHQDQGGNE